MNRDKFVVHAQVVNGHLQLTTHHKTLLRNFFIQNEGATMVFSVQKAPKDISDSLRKTYFGVWLPAILQEIGLDNTTQNKNDTHKQLMLEFNPKLETNLFGHSVTVPGSLSDLTQEEFLEIIERIDRWFGTSFGKSLPEPQK